MEEIEKLIPPPFLRILTWLGYAVAIDWISDIVLEPEKKTIVLMCCALTYGFQSAYKEYRNRGESRSRFARRILREFIPHLRIHVSALIRRTRTAGTRYRQMPTSAKIYAKPRKRKLLQTKRKRRYPM